MKNKNILITGSGSGFGKYLNLQLSKNKSNRIYKLTRKNKKKLLKNCRKKKFDLIFHCAASRPKYKKKISKKKYFEDNVNLTKQILDFSFLKIIFISTVDVYPKNLGICNENAKIKKASLSNTYAKTKLQAENEVIKKNKNYIIVRVGSIIGKTMKKNIIYKIIMNKIKKVPYSKNSEINIISYKFLNSFISLLIKNNKKGIYNCANTQNEKIKNLSNNINNFGNNEYLAPKISLKKSKKFILQTLSKNKIFYSKKSLF